MPTRETAKFSTVIPILSCVHVSRGTEKPFLKYLQAQVSFVVFRYSLSKYILGLILSVLDTFTVSESTINEMYMDT